MNKAINTHLFDRYHQPLAKDTVQYVESEQLINKRFNTAAEMRQLVALCLCVYYTSVCMSV